MDLGLKDLDDSEKREIIRRTLLEIKKNHSQNLNVILAIAHVLVDQFREVTESYKLISPIIE